MSHHTGRLHDTLFTIEDHSHEGTISYIKNSSKRNMFSANTAQEVERRASIRQSVTQAAIERNSSQGRMQRVDSMPSIGSEEKEIKILPDSHEHNSLKDVRTIKGRRSNLSKNSLIGLSRPSDHLLTSDA